MNKIFILLFCLTAQAAWAQIEPMDALIESEKSAWLAHAVQDREIQGGANNRSDVQYCRTHWTVDPTVKYIKGDVMTVFEPTESISNLEFDLSLDMQVDSIKYHNQALTFTHGGDDVLSIQFPATLPAFLKDSVTIFYHGIPTSTGFGAFEVNVHGNTPVMWTLSEPYGAKEWWPCKQSLDDKIDSIDIYVTAPAMYTVASNGLMKSEVVSGNLKTTHWKHRYPVAAYLVCMAVTDYTVFTTLAPFQGDTTKIINYVYPESVNDAQNGLIALVQQMQVYDSLFGMYPFQQEKYGHAQFGWGGGMEHQTITYVQSWGFELLAHELAHHWFGDKVTCASWQDIWLNESFATYLSGLCYENLQPQYWRNFRQNRMNGVVSQPGGSVFVDDTTSVGRIFSGRLSYSKGALVLHMARWICGDDAFFGALKNYLHDPALAYGYAHTDNLKQHLETASGKDFTGFLADWYYGQGYLSYQITWSETSDKQLTVTLHQSQSHPSVSYFELPVPVLLRNGTQDTLLVLDNTFNGQSYTLPIGFQADTLIFDPELWLLTANNYVYKVASGANNPASLDLSIQIAPNPTHGLIHLQIDSKISGKVEMGLYALNGQQIRSWDNTLNTGANNFTLDASDVPAGNYLVRVSKGNQQQDQKVTIY